MFQGQSRLGVQGSVPRSQSSERNKQTQIPTLTGTFFKKNRIIGNVYGRLRIYQACARHFTWVISLHTKTIVPLSVEEFSDLLRSHSFTSRGANV